MTPRHQSEYWGRLRQGRYRSRGRGHGRQHGPGQRRDGDVPGLVRDALARRARALACPFRQVHRKLQREPHIAIDDLGRISAPTLLVIGDDDLISIEHSAALFRAIPNSELAVVPGASHAVAIEKPEFLNRIVLDFFQNEPVPTMMPLRRAATGAEMLYPDCLGKHPWPCAPHSAPLLATWAKTRCRVLPSCGAARP